MCSLVGCTMSVYAINNETRSLEIMENTLELDGPFNMELLAGGFSGSEVLKISTNERAYVIRFWNMQWAEYFFQDLACQLIASEAGYGPKVYYSNEAEGIIVMDYVAPDLVPELPERLPLLVALLKKIHHGPTLPHGIDRSDYLDMLIDETKGLDLFDIEILRKIKNVIFACTRPGAESVPCHRDLHHGNLIYSQNSYSAIDYTWGAMDDPYADLANIAIFNCKTPEEERYLLQLYLGREPTLKELSRLSLMKIPSMIFYGLEFWGLAHLHKSEDAFIVEALSKSYMDFGHHHIKTSSNELYNFALSLLNDVIEYIQSNQYGKDLEAI